MLEGRLLNTRVLPVLRRVQVWGGETLQTVHAVEKAAPMLALGHSCHKALRAAGVPVPGVRWSRRLAPQPADSRLAAQR